jgi:hypothetical protein
MINIENTILASANSGEIWLIKLLGNEVRK